MRKSYIVAVSAVVATEVSLVVINAVRAQPGAPPPLALPPFFGNAS